MKVIVARSAGFCMGVRRAVDKARSLLSSAESRVYTDGPLIHNRQMVDRLESEGVTECDDPASLSDGILLVRAHGISPERRRMLQGLPVKLEDATCPDVARIQGLVRKYVHKGYQLVIFGDTGHPEVVGLLGYAEGRGHVVGSAEAVSDLPDLARVCLVAQSTQFVRTYDEVAHAARERFPEVEVLDTICASTKARQKELEEMARAAEAIVVVGGRHSANTVRLAALARTLLPTFHIQTADDLEPGDFADFDVVALTAGASTPDEIIEAVREKLQQM
ncbi:4-hydroxy-3-methylbut-2-enyl diphosphate reductase [Verrucomicrobiota bacterium]